jgi:hypothetical protein
LNPSYCTNFSDFPVYSFMVYVMMLSVAQTVCSDDTE